MDQRYILLVIYNYIYNLKFKDAYITCKIKNIKEDKLIKLYISLKNLFMNYEEN